MTRPEVTRWRRQLADIETEVAGMLAPLAAYRRQREAVLKDGEDCEPTARDLAVDRLLPELHAIGEAAGRASRVYRDELALLDAGEVAGEVAGDAAPPAKEINCPDTHTAMVYEAGNGLPDVGDIVDTLEQPDGSVYRVTRIGYPDGRYRDIVPGDRGEGDNMGITLSDLGPDPDLPDETNWYDTPLRYVEEIVS